VIIRLREIREGWLCGLKEERNMFRMLVSDVRMQRSFFSRIEKSLFTDRRGILRSWKVSEGRLDLGMYPEGGGVGRYSC
jgi:hypothetical protein